MLWFLLRFTIYSLSRSFSCLILLTPTRNPCLSSLSLFSSSFTSSISDRFLFSFEEPFSKKADFPCDSIMRIKYKRKTYSWNWATSLGHSQTLASSPLKDSSYAQFFIFSALLLHLSLFGSLVDQEWIAHRRATSCQDGSIHLHLADTWVAQASSEHKPWNLQWWVHQSEERLPPSLLISLHTMES